MLEMFEKLINEHGSSVILKERIELISDKYALLEETNVHLKSKVETLENSLAIATNEISDLKEQLSSYQNKENSGLGKNELSLLNHLFNSNNEIQIGQLASVINTDISTTKYHVQNLQDSDFIDRVLLLNAPETYKINKNGIKYIVESKSA